MNDHEHLKYVLKYFHDDFTFFFVSQNLFFKSKNAIM